MSELIRYSQPAERDRGLSWADRFESQALVESNGGVVAGTPTFSPGGGVVLDGSATVVYALTGSEVGSDFSAVFEFTPDFEADEAVFNRFFFDFADGATGNRTYLYHAAGGNISLKLFGTPIVTVGVGTYGPLWQVGQRNTFVVSGTSGNTSLFFNKIKVADSDPSTFTWGAVSRLGVGSRYDGTPTLFKGTIHRLQVYKTQLEDSLALALSNGEANVLPLVGAVPNSTPAERAAGLSWGWSSEVSLDGTNDYFEEALTGGEFDSASISIACFFTPDFAPDDGVDHVLYDNDPATDRFLCIKRAAGTMTLYLGGTAVATIAQATYEGAWVTNGRNVLVISGTSGANKAWLNGILIATSATAWTQKRPTSFFAGSYRTAGAGKFDGQIHLFQVYRAQLADVWCERISKGKRLGT